MNKKLFILIISLLDTVISFGATQVLVYKNYSYTLMDEIRNIAEKQKPKNLALLQSSKIISNNNKIIKDINRILFDTNIDESKTKYQFWQFSSCFSSLDSDLSSSISINHNVLPNIKYYIGTKHTHKLFNQKEISQLYDSKYNLPTSNRSTMFLIGTKIEF